MNKLLLRGGLPRATRYCTGSPFLQSSVRYQSSEELEVEVSQDRREDDIAHVGNTVDASAANGSSIRQVNGLSAYRREGVAPLPRPLLPNGGGSTQPQNGLNGSRLSRPDSVASARGAADTTSTATVSAPSSPPSFVNGAKLFLRNAVTAASADAQLVKGVDTAPVIRNFAPGRQGGQQSNNNSNENRSQEQARDSWTLALNLKRGGTGGKGGTHPKQSSTNEQMGAPGAAANGRSDPLNNLPFPAGGGFNRKAPPRSAPAANRWTNRFDNGVGTGSFGRAASRSQISPQEAAAAKLAAMTGSMPWNLPAAREKDDSDTHDHRETLDKMLGGGRYGGSGASHRGEQGPPRKRREVSVTAKEIKIPAVAVPVRELALMTSKKAREVIIMLRQLGETNVSPSSMVEPEIAEMVAKEFGLRTKLLTPRESERGRTVVTEATFDSLAPRPPVVSVMGHVDHGKTTLLDALRSSKAKVAGTEAAGITQKIGAFSVGVAHESSDHESSVTFFDTPGHAAFKSMRHATSRLTDIVVVVIAADDGVKSQTVEVFDLLKEFPNLTPVVAVTKIDQYSVDTEEAVDRISRQLLEHSIITEGYGGEVPVVPVSAVTREGFDDLLETLLLQAEILELRADDKASAEGLVVDSAIVKGKGTVTDVLVTWGKLKVADVVVAGMEYGKVRGLINSGGKSMKVAGAAEPVRIVGMKGLPKMGDELMVVDSEATARDIVAQRKKQREVEELEQQAETLGDKRLSEQATKRLKDRAAAAIRRRERALYESREATRLMKSRRDEASKAEAKAKEEAAARAMKFAEEAIRMAEAQDVEAEDVGPKKCFAIFKAEGFGMLEAMSQVITEVPQDEVELSLVKTGLGSVTQSDVEAAAIAQAPIFAFNVGAVPADVKAMAQREGVQIHTHNVIYRFLDDVKAVMSSLLPPGFKETIIGEAKTLQVFQSTGPNKEKVMIAGLSVSSGKLNRAQFFRVLRDDKVLVDRVKAASMRHHKDKVNEVTKDKECGLALKDFDEFKEGDVLQCYTLDEIERTFG